MIDIYRKEVCINCTKEKCKNRIEIIKKQELLDKEIKTVTIIKCIDFNCKNKRKKQPLNWGSVYDRL